MSWVVEPNVVGGWDVRPADSLKRHSRHSTRDDAVAAARELGGPAVVQGPRGDVLERIGAAGAAEALNKETAAAPAAPARRPAPAPPAPPPAAPARRAAPAPAAPASPAPRAAPAPAAPAPAPATPATPATPASTPPATVAPPPAAAPATPAPVRRAATPAPGPAARPGLRLAQLLALTDQTDETGRLLMEDSAPRQAIRKAERGGISMKTVPAPYQDTPSRHGGQMNAAAYDALRRDTAEILSGFAWLAANHHRLAPSETGAPRRLYAVSYLGISLVHVLFHRAADPVPPHTQLPSYIASIFKASRGIFSFSVQIENDLGPSRALTAAEVVQYAEDKKQLVRPDTGRVCAAPTRLIERSLEAILLETGEAAGARSRLPDLVDFGALWEFYRQQDAVGEALSRFRVVAERMSTAAGNDPARLFRSVIPGGPARGQTFGQFAEGTLRTVNEAQAAMNRALGRSENAKPVGLQELLRLL